MGGTTSPSGFPATAGAFDTTHNGGSFDAFVTRLSPSGSSLVYSTFLGGVSIDSINALAVDAQGQATVAGWTRYGVPTTPGAFDRTFNGTPGTQGCYPYPYSDAFVTRLSPDGSSLVYSTYLGGTHERDFAYALALDARGQATVAGYTESSTFPTTPGAFDTTFNGVSGYCDIMGDAFVARLDMLPTGVSAYGTSSPGCTGPLAISVTSMPQVGNTAFSLTCGNAPPNALGCLLVGVARFTQPPTVLGIDVLVDLVSGTFFAVSVGSNQVGRAEFVMPIGPDPTLQGFQFFTQFLWIGPGAPAPCPAFGLSASNALDITVQ